MGYCDPKDPHSGLPLATSGPCSSVCTEAACDVCTPPTSKRAQGEGGLAVSWASNGTCRQQFDELWMNQSQVTFFSECMLKFYIHVSKNVHLFPGGGGLGHMWWGGWDASMLFQSIAYPHSRPFSFSGLLPRKRLSIWALRKLSETRRQASARETERSETILNNFFPNVIVYLILHDTKTW